MIVTAMTPAPTDTDNQILPENFLKTQNLRPIPKPTESEPEVYGGTHMHTALSDTLESMARTLHTTLHPPPEMGNQKQVSGTGARPPRFTHCASLVSIPS